MRNRICLFLLLFLTACVPHHTLPQEIIAMREPIKQPAPALPKLIVVDAGHGGKDAGAASKRFDYEEKALTLQTALAICRHLNELGYKTQLTRSSDAFIPLEKRAEMANELNADLFVSIHYNFSANEEAKGIEIFTYHEAKTPTSKRVIVSKEVGHEVLKSLVRETKATSRGLKEANFAVIRETKMPAILIEAGFLSNAVERKKLRDPTYLELIALGIAKGVDRYLTQNHQHRWH
jgi:N-acetylmuramoyl-L-alanine amidase